MRVTLFAYSRQGCRTALRAAACFPEDRVTLYAPERIAEGEFLPIPKPSEPCYAEAFRLSDCLVFIGSCGIAVRQIAPSVKDKLSDPAVLCIDELGRFVISLLSGHVGGANALTTRLADALGAVPVITTATDINQKFAVDFWAKQNGFLLDDRKLAKAVSAAVLEGTVPFVSEYPVSGAMPAGLTAGGQADLGIYLGVHRASPFANTLHLIPRRLHLGIGCRRRISVEAVREAVETVFAENDLDLRAVAGAASIDLKSEEAGLLQWCEESGIPVTFYSAEQLRSVEGDFTASEFVRGVTGVENVCERSALLGADRLLVKKTARCGVTVAVAEERLEIHFG